MAKSIKERLAEKIELLLGSGGTCNYQDLKTTKGPRWSNDSVAWSGKVYDATGKMWWISSYDTMTDLVKSEKVCFINESENHFKEMSTGGNQ